MKKNLIKVQTWISFEHIGIYRIPLQLKVSIFNGTNSIIEINKLCLKVKHKYLFIGSFYESDCNIKIKAGDSLECYYRLKEFINMYGISKLFKVKIYTNIGTLKSDSISIKGG